MQFKKPHNIITGKSMITLLICCAVSAVGNPAIAEEAWEGVFKGKTSDNEDVSFYVSLKTQNTLQITYLDNPCNIPSLITWSGETSGTVNFPNHTASYSSQTDSWSGKYHYTDCEGSGLVEVPWLSDRYAAYPAISINPTSQAMQADLGTETRKIFTIFNTGEFDLEITDIRQKIYENGFNVIDNNCTGKLLRPQYSCAFTVTFTPDSLETKSTTYQVISNDPDDGILEIALTGSGRSTDTGRRVDLTPIYLLLLKTPEDS